MKVPADRAEPPMNLEAVRIFCARPTGIDDDPTRDVLIHVHHVSLAYVFVDF